MDDSAVSEAESRDIRSSLQAAHARIRQARHELQALSQGRHDGLALNNPLSISSSHLLMNPGHEAVVLVEAPYTATFNSTVARSYQRSLYDDSATLIGRRIAAREAAQHSPQGESAWPVADASRRGRDAVPELLSEDFQTRQHSEDHASESGLRDERHRDSLPHRRVSGPEMDFTRSDFHNVFEPNYSSNSSSPRSRSQPRGSVSNYSSRSSSLISSVLNMSRRLSLLTEVSLRNFSSPASTLLHASETDEPSVTLSSNSPSQTTTHMNSAAEGRRRYVIRRRLDSLGEEVVRHIHLDFEDQALSDLPLGSGESNPAQQLSFVSNSSNDNLFPSDMFPSSGSATRRHVWSRLNADGDEIPVDEEELERLRMNYRLRVQNRIGQRDGPIYSDMPLSESPINDAVPLPHARADDSVAIFRAGTDAQGRLKLRNEPGPFRPSILPIPLSEMIPSQDSSYTKDHAIPVSEVAHFACR